MDDHRYAELLSAVLDLRSATQMSFAKVHQRFDEQEARFQNRADAMEERWDCRFGALEGRVEGGFHAVEDRFGGIEATLGDIRDRLSVVEQR